MEAYLKYVDEPLKKLIQVDKELEYKGKIKADKVLRTHSGSIVKEYVSDTQTQRVCF